MDSPRPSRSKFDALHWAIVLFTITVLAALAAQFFSRGLARYRLIRQVNYGMQIATLATIMANDEEDTSDTDHIRRNPDLGWPGDLCVRTGPGKIDRLGQYVDRLIEYDYIKRVDAPMLFGGPGVPDWNGHGELTTDHCAFKLFKVKKADSGSTILAETRNYTYNQPLAAGVKPFGDGAFVVTRKDTSTTSFLPSQYNLWRQIGTLTGQESESQQPGVETPGMILP